MKIENGWRVLGDGFDGCKIEMTHDEFNVLNMVFRNLITYDKLKALGFTEDQIRIAFNFARLY